MRVLHVASEVAPFAQSGGLADVVAGLPAAQARAHGLTVAVLVPLYRGVAARIASANLALDDGWPIELAFGERQLAASIRTLTDGGVRYGFVDCPELYDRPGHLYGPGGASEWPDNHLRFAALGKAAVACAARLLGGEPDVLHVHDWQGGPAAIYARLAQRPWVIVSTIHNLAYRGIFPKAVMTELGIPWSLFTSELAEFWDQLSFLKGALAVSDAVTTVSPGYAAEIITPERGEGLDGFLRANVRRLVGIVNGIDVESWDPATDPALPARFSEVAPAGKATCRQRLAEEVGLELAADEPLIGVVARMTAQKGLDLIADLVPALHRVRARMIVLGAGEPELEARFRWLANVFGDHLVVRVGFDPALARRIYGGCDLFVMPSRFEPCGLGQLYAMRYGTIPIVHAVGGLRDTVRDLETGVRFEPATAAALELAIERGIALVRDPQRRSTVRRAAMRRDSSWRIPALEYVDLYRALRG